MTPEQFKLVAIAAIERQIAAGSRLVSGEWGEPGEDGCPLACGCALTLLVQDGDPLIALKMLTGEYDAEDRVAAYLGISAHDVLGFASGFDGDAGHGPWHKAGSEAAAMFAVGP